MATNKKIAKKRKSEINSLEELNPKIVLEIQDYFLKRVKYHLGNDAKICSSDKIYLFLPNCGKFHESEDQCVVYNNYKIKVTPFSIEIKGKGGNGLTRKTLKTIFPSDYSEKEIEQTIYRVSKIFSFCRYLNKNNLEKICDDGLLKTSFGREGVFT